jgi:glycosyltransferase involved in cell wall biosynthesis
MIERHIITGEYPPDDGGVAGHTAVIAAALAGCGEEVHVWCPGTSGPSDDRGVTVHREMGGLGPADLRRVSAALQGSRRLLVQWVPHAFGRRSLNVAFCRWLLRRRHQGDEIDVIVHEPFLPFAGSLKLKGAAAVHRLMTAYVLRSAARAWITIPAWESYLRPYAPKRDLGFEWLPVPSTIPVDRSAARPAEAPLRRFLIGSFPTGERYAEDVLRDTIVPLLATNPLLYLSLIGRRSEAARDGLLGSDESLHDRILATGAVDFSSLSRRVAACDVAVQPYADGICGRRTSAMVFLAHGRPLVTTDGRFTESLWRDNAVALVPAAAPRSVGQAVENLIANRHERERLARAGHELYAARFDVRHAATALHRAVG